MKFSRFTNIIRSSSYLLHNTLYNTAMKVNSNELKKYIDDISEKDKFAIDTNDTFQKTLNSLRMVVEDDQDELSILNSNYFWFEHNSELSIILIVTRKCNFRCTYCYQEYENRDMSQNVYDDVTSFIINQIKKNKFKNVYISFFGGEPTLRANEINNFMKNLLIKNSELDNPASIRGIITTNGYLLKPNIIEEFLANKIVRYQITVDGLENEHNSSRYLTDKSGTWDTIIKNLMYFKSVKNKEVSVLIRTNVTPEIYENIDEWLEFLNNNFNDSKVYRIHFEAAKNYGKMNKYDIKLCDNETEVILDIIDKAKKWRLPLELIGFRTAPFSLICYAARYFHYIVDYDGTVKKCTSSSLDEPYNTIGTLKDGNLVIDFEKAARWTSYNLSNNCIECEILPICYGRKCPACRDYYKNCEFLQKSYLKGLEYLYLS